MSNSFENFLVPQVESVQYPWNGLLAQAAQAKGSEINGTLGVFLDEDLKIGILPSMAETVNLDRTSITPYAPSHGLPALRSAWKKRLLQLGHLASNAEDRCSSPVVTQGITSALTLVSQLFLEAGKSELILPSPFWPNYRLIFQKIGKAKLREYDLFEESGALNLQALEASLNASHKSVTKELPLVLLLNLPHNPTGYTYTEAETEKLSALLSSFLENHKDRNLVVVLDDAYLGFNYDKACLPHSLMRVLTEVHERMLCVHLSGATKEIYAWGLRVGFISFASKSIDADALKMFEDKAAALIRGSMSNVSMLSQQLTVNALEDKRTQVTHDTYYKMLQTRYDACIKEIDSGVIDSHFSALPFNSGYFFTLKLKSSAFTAYELRTKLLSDFNVGVVALSDELVRIAFSSIPSAKIPKLFASLAECCDTMKKAS